MKSQISQSKIHIALAFDENYFNQFFALATSIFKNNNLGEIVIHAIVKGIDIRKVDKIKQYIEDQNSEIYFYNIKEEEINELVVLNQWTSTVYYRLYFPLLLPKSIERFLYLDVDTIVLNNLGSLWQTDMDSFPVAAVYDNYVKVQPLLGIHKEGEYFNSGVLLINRAVWNNQKISERTIEYLKNHPDRILFVDQCGLNAVLHNNWYRLEDKYNFIYSSIPAAARMIELKELVKHIVIIHFTLHRPWNMLCQNRLAYVYFEYLNLSPLRDIPRYTDFSLKKLPRFIRLKLLHLYLDLPGIARIWRLIKKLMRL